MNGLLHLFTRDPLLSVRCDIELAVAHSAHHGWSGSDEEQGGGEAAQIHAIAADGLKCQSLFGYQLLARPSLSKS